MPCDLLNDLTIVIPSYGRQAFLRRQIKYWGELPAKIIILDGSPEAALGLGSLDWFEYYHLPVSLEDRFEFVIDKITTEYAALLSDDEFFLPSGLQKCVKFLENNPDYVSCKGRALGFDWRNNKIVYRDVYPGLADYRIDAENGCDRVTQHMMQYQMATLWAVLRADAFVKTLAAIGAGPKFRSAAIGEIQTSIIASYLGKCKVIDSLMWLRSFENPNIWWRDGRQSIVQWFKDPSNTLEHERFSLAVSSVLNLSEGPNVDLPLTAVKEYVAVQAAKQQFGFCDRCKILFKTLLHSSPFLRKILAIGKDLRMSVSPRMKVFGSSASSRQVLDPREVQEMLSRQSVQLELSDLLYASEVISSFYRVD